MTRNLITKAKLENPQDCFISLVTCVFTECARFSPACSGAENIFSTWYVFFFSA